MAKFSKAHYVALAKVIRETEQCFGYNGDFPLCEVLRVLKGRFSVLLAADNPKFDLERFLKAATTPEVKR